MEVLTATGCVNHAHPASPFSDSLSPLAVGAFADNRSGIDTLYLKGLSEGSIPPTFRPFMQARARVGGEWQMLHTESRSSAPWGWTEVCCAGSARLELEVTMPQAACLTIAVRSLSGCCDMLAFSGTVRPEMGTLSLTAAELLLHRYTYNKYLKNDCTFDLRFSVPGARVSKGRLSSQFRIEYPLSEDGSGVISIEVQAGDTVVSTEDAPPSEERWREWIERLPEPKPATEFWRQRLVQAVQVVESAAVRMKGYGNFSEEVGVLASASNWSSTAFFWDHIFSSAVLGMLDTDMHASAIRCHIRHATNGRITPGILLAFPEYTEADDMGDCYAPIASWSIMKSPFTSTNEAVLRELYPYLKQDLNSWYGPADRDGDGIPEWRNTGNPADNSPLYDAYAPKPGATCFAIPPFVSVNLCSYLLMAMRCLKTAAERLDLKQDAIEWQERADAMDRYILENLWDEQDLFFYDRTPDGDVTRVKTFFGLLPLWAGVSLPRDLARRAVETHLLNPDEFWGEIPFPSVAYSEPTYDPGGYWRGRSWPHLYFWNTEILWAYGYCEEAEHAKQRFLECNATWAGPAENFPTDPAMIDAPGVLNYNWGAAALAYFLLNWHHKPLQEPS